MESESARNRCFVCYNRVHSRKQSLTPRQVEGYAEDSKLSPLTPSDSEIFLKFAEFAKCYLKLDKNDVDSTKVAVLCKSCSPVVNGIVGLYEQFCEVENRLSSSLVELGKLMKISLEHVGTKSKKKPGIRELIATKCLEKDENILQASGSDDRAELSETEQGFVADDGDEDKGDYVAMDVEVKIEEEDGSPNEDAVQVKGADEERSEVESGDEEEVEVDGVELTAAQAGDPLSSFMSPKTFSDVIYVENSDEDSDIVYVPEDTQSESDDSDDDDAASSNGSFPEPHSEISECNDTDDDVNDDRETERKRIVLSDVVKLMSNQVNQEKGLLEHQHEAPIRDQVQSNISAAVSPLSANEEDDVNNEKAPDINSSGNFACEHCHRHFDTSQGLYTHMLSHESKSSKLRKSCPFCYKKFTLTQTQKLHMEIHHPSITSIDKPFACDGKRCVSSFKTLLELNNHISKHCEDILLKCPACQWGFVDAHHLKVHEILHTPPKNGVYHCPVCKCRFQKVKELQIHFDYKHGRPCLGLQLIDSHKDSSPQIEEHEMVPKIPCPHCKEGIPIAEDLTLHSKKCLMNSENLVPYKTRRGNNCKRARCHKCVKWIRESTRRNHLIWHSFHQKLENERKAEEYSDSSCEEEDVTEPEIISTSNFSCNQCWREFPVLKSLYSHLVWHDKQSTEQGTPCCFCFKTLVLQETQRMHMQVKHPSIFATEKPFACDEEDCDSSFATLSKINAHVVTHGKPISYCSFCKWGFVSPDRLKLHEVLHLRPKQGFYCCPKCNCKTRYMRDLQIHFNFRHGTKSSHVDLFECSKCDKRFWSEMYLKRHILKKHKKSLTKKQQCQHCKSRFRFEKTLMTHLQTCLKNPKNYMLTKNEAGKLMKKFRCNTCGKFVLHMQSHLATHMEIDEKRMQKKERERVTCETCGISCVNDKGLERHVNRVHKKIMPRVQCELCGKSLGGRWYLKMHIDIVHKNVNVKMTCEICGKVLAHAASLNAHLKNHKEGKRYSCHLCDGRFWANNDLKKHLVRMHGKTVGDEFSPGEGLVLRSVCLFPSCGAKFETDVELQQHVEGNHTPVATSKFMCNLCGKVFANQGRLTRHNLVHSKEKPYNCHVCGKAFAYKASLKQHLLVRHSTGEGQQYYSCEQPNCEAKFKWLNYLNRHVRDIHGLRKDVVNSKT